MNKGEAIERMKIAIEDAIGTDDATVTQEEIANEFLGLYPPDSEPAAQAAYIDALNELIDEAFLSIAEDIKSSRKVE